MTVHLNIHWKSCYRENLFMETFHIFHSYYTNKLIIVYLLHNIRIVRGKPVVIGDYLTWSNLKDINYIHSYVLPWTISHGKKSCNRLVDWSICLRPAETFSVANNMKCHIKVILAIFVVKSNQKSKTKSKM